MHTIAWRHLEEKADGLLTLPAFCTWTANFVNGRNCTHWEETLQSQCNDFHSPFVKKIGIDVLNEGMSIRSCAAALVTAFSCVDVRAFYKQATAKLSG